MATSFDLFGTLVDAERPDDPAAAVAAALSERGVRVPADWDAAYGGVHVRPDAPARAEVSLSRHVAAALASRGIEAGDGAVGAAVRDAFDRRVRLRDAADDAVAAADERGPVGVLSNCSVAGLVDRTLARVGLAAFDAVVTSVDCGWRKPDPRAFEAVAAELGVAPADLIHVGDDPTADGGVERVGGRALLVGDRGLERVSERVAERA